MQEADSEHCTACKSSTANVSVKLELQGTYWISLSMIALFENVKQMNKISCSSEKEKKLCTSCSILGLFVTKDTLSQALRDEQHMFT